MKTAAIHRDHATFRVVLQAMSHPGAPFQLPAQEPRAGEYAPLIQLLSCLMDNEVSFAIVGDDCSPLAMALVQHTGSPRADICESDFVIAIGGTTSGQMSRIKRGTLEYPDGGATLVYLVDGIMGEGGTVELSGPGVNGTVRPLFTGLSAAELGGLREINAEYPLGVDAVFLDTNGRIACIPRSSRIGEY